MFNTSEHTNVIYNNGYFIDCQIVVKEHQMKVLNIIRYTPNDSGLIVAVSFPILSLELHRYHFS